MKGKFLRWLMYVFAPWIVEQEWFWIPLRPLEWFEYWCSMEKQVTWGNPSKSNVYISEQSSIVGVTCPVGHVADSDSNMDTWELMRYRARHV